MLIRQFQQHPTSRTISQSEKNSYPRQNPHRMEPAGGGECYVLKGNMEERAERLALYVLENRTTVRSAAQKFGISKSSVHMVIVKWNGLCGPLSKPDKEERISACHGADMRLFFVI